MLFSFTASQNTTRTQCGNKSSLSEPLDVLYEDGTFYKTEPYEVFQKLNLRFQEDSFSTM